MTDILREFLDRLAAAEARHGALSTERAREIEAELRREYAGERSLIRKNPDRQKRRVEVLDDVKRGLKPDAAAKKHGVSRSLVYEIYRNRGRG